MVKESPQTNACTWCGEFDSKPHEEFDYYKHPQFHGQLRALDLKLKSLPADERLYEMENYAARRGLIRNAQITDSKGNKKPDGGTVVMPGYGRLLSAYKWLKELRKHDAEIAKSQAVASGLPF